MRERTITHNSKKYVLLQEKRKKESETTGFFSVKVDFVSN
jgi:hypothetical protein